MKKKRESEVAEARRKAEEARKQQEKQKAAKKFHCVSHTSNEIAGLLPCVMAGGDVTPVIDPTLTAVVWEITGLNDLRECIKNPAFGACTAFAISVLPVGKVKLLKKLGEGIEDIAESTRIAKAAKCFKCFLAGTKVLMADRSKVNIESVKTGDAVISTDPVSGETGRRTVTNVIVTEHDKKFNELSIATPQGKQHLSATNEHPFWSPSAKAWVEAGRLHPGMTLRSVDGSTVKITGNRPFAERARTYNLTVNGLHTYYVLAGATPVLVHNSDGLCGVTSVIHNDPFLVGAAEAAGKNERVQKEMNDLVKQFRGGNTNPGLGSKSLAGTDISHLRGRRGGRVFYRNTSDGMQIVAKADKNNEPNVIQRLLATYGK
ncbi:polymorphic toxin-type HINT domain-containing protein [Streptomyces tubercidicus]|uniref:Hint domain-containing protein n=1 Tax=Streptomyces tubercidicus TaxID=47759 RepID=A0A640UJZ6_9ACTN|nr:polymorphic toxin-type HINT domain-containing protein [Streptomyces tubercidicus]WAU10709.1 HINT domain-containing protein [Streptomyces tubercidicus]GFE35860.1 hypothetical protein Stube_05330 [Streptomyces tubercidicus]